MTQRLWHYRNNLHPSGWAPVMRVDLNYTGGASNKVYILEIVRNPTTKLYDLTAYYGRNGAALQSKAYGSFRDFESARAALRKKETEKERKGYVYVHGEDTKYIPSGQGNTQIQLASVGALNQYRMAESFIQNLKPVGFEDVDNKTFHRRFVTSDNFILQTIPDKRLVYLNDCQNQWQVVDAYDTSYYYPQWGTELPPRTPEHVGTTWLGYFNDDRSQFIILDLAYHPSLKDIYKKPWKDRRMIMNVVYDQLFPNLDPYDSTNPMYFADYYYEDKDRWYAAARGLWIARNISHPLQAKMFATEKP